MNIKLSDSELKSLDAALQKGRDDVRAAMIFLESPEFMRNRLSEHEKKLIDVITVQLAGMLLLVTMVIEIFERAEGTLQ